MTYLPNGAYGRRSLRDMKRDLPDGAKAKLAGRNRALIQYPDGARAYRLHLTDVVYVAPDGTVQLNDGGFPTITTRAAMGEGLAKLANFPGSVASGGKDSNHRFARSWSDDKAINFEHRLVLDPDGHVIETDFAPNERKALKAKIKKFAARVHDFDKLPEPQGFVDCLYCCRSTDDEVVGDVGGSNGHLRSHLDEDYLHGSLIWNALRAKGLTNHGAALWFHLANDERPHERRRARNEIATAIRRYLSKRLGVAT